MFADIFDRHHSELYRYLHRQAGEDLAADLAAETFVRVLGLWRVRGTPPRRPSPGASHGKLSAPGRECRGPLQS
jgi:DNA-directed RNA polymerase specialized sigma24 family protein